MKHIKKINEFNTEYDDHKVDHKVDINNDKKIGKKDRTYVPVDYFHYFDDYLDSDDYYTTSPEDSGLYNGVEPGYNKGLNKLNSAPYKMSAESVNVQDIMSFPTYLKKFELFRDKVFYYYEEIKKIKEISYISPILNEKIDNLIGFSFLVFNEKIFIMTDMKNVYMLINKHLIPLNKTDNLFNIIQNELY